MNLTKTQRIKVYNAQLLVHNAIKELDELVADGNLGNAEWEIIQHQTIRLIGNRTFLKSILDQSKDE